MLRPAAGDDTYGVKLPPFGLVLLLGAFASLGAMVLQKMPDTSEAAIPASLEASAELSEPSEPPPPESLSVTKPSPPEALVDVAAAAPQAPETAGEVAREDLATIAPPRETAAPVVDPVGVLPAAVAADEPVQPIPEFEVALLERMNAARVSDSANELVRDDALDIVALARARNLVELDYFDHYAPDGTSAFSELAARGLPYFLAGENLARNNYPPAQTVVAAFEGLMASPGHRANILEPRFGAVGVAAVRDGNVWLYVTVFTNPR